MKKSVTINEERNCIHLLVKWNSAYRLARMNNYQSEYLDRLRFQKRIITSEIILYKILNFEHRTEIYNKRFSSM